MTKPTIEEAAKSYAAKYSTTFREWKPIHSEPVIDPEEYDAYLAGAKEGAKREREEILELLRGDFAGDFMKRGIMVIAAAELEERRK